ncbi:transporter [Pseudozyma hubeiensis SY62]|uniref:Transporter n=1 Tax=Pseudozyma hubeiensis (strain SY62) TaxID=1305764 RepID=R9P608_PSEHS|nr:transporter [Pseudozyma hubeiensis SY62]GAC96687.1 transporter [Pseudozyma hubeiensis SY62]
MPPEPNQAHIAAPPRQALGRTASDGTTSQAPTSDATRDDAYIAKLNKWWTDEEESSIRRKLDVRIVTVSFLLYLVALLDRSGIGNAKTAGLEKSLRMSDSQFQWLLTIFYIAYILFQFQVVMYKLLPPRIWVTFCVFVWGVAGVCQAATTSWSGMMAARFFLAVSEAGYGTGFALYLSFFYPKTETGLRFGWFISAGAISSAIAGAIAYGLVHAKTSVEPWRLLFLIEGVPTLIMAPAAYFFLPNSIQSAKFLTPREKQIAEARLFRPPPSAALQIKEAHPFSWHSIKQQLNLSQAAAAFTDPMSYITAALFFIINVGYSSVPVYTPTLISEMGFGSIKAQGLSAPPYVLAFILSLFFCWLTDRLQIRGPICTVLLIIGAIGYLMLTTLRSTAARYVGIWLVINGLFPFIPILYMWLMDNQASESKKGLGLVIFATIGQCGPLLGTHLFPASEAPYYVRGTAVSAGLLLFGVLVSAGLSVRFWSVNRRRDRRDATVEQGGENVEAKGDVKYDGKARSYGGELEGSMTEADRRKIDVLLHGEESPYFRYTI